MEALESKTLFLVEFADHTILTCGLILKTGLILSRLTIYVKLNQGVLILEMKLWSGSVALIELTGPAPSERFIRNHVCGKTRLDYHSDN